MTEVGPCGQAVEWRGCYKGQHDLLTAESVAHPAKMAVGLCYRIMGHLKELGLLGVDSVVLDPMAGTGMTGLVAATLGLRSVMVELEPKFISFIQENKAALEKRLGRLVDMEIIQGDSRHLSGLLAERGLCAITSPPYAESVKGNFYEKARQDVESGKYKGKRPDCFISEHNIGARALTGYSNNPANIGNLIDRPLEQSDRMFIDSGQAFFHSPGNTIKCQFVISLSTSWLGISGNIFEQDCSVLFFDPEIWKKLREQFSQMVISGHATSPNLFSTLSQFLDTNTKQKIRELIFNPTKPLVITHTDFQRRAEMEGSSLASNIHAAFAVYKPSQISEISVSTHDVIIRYLADKSKPDRVILTSPPYQDNAEFGGGIDWVKANRPDRLSPSPKRRNVQGLNPGGYGQTPGQIGSLPDRPIVITSPPYSDVMQTNHTGIDWMKTKKDYPGRVMHEERIALAHKHHDNLNYGDTPGQIGKLRE